MYIVLFSLLFIINVGIGAYFVYYKYVNRNKKNVSKYFSNFTYKMGEVKQIYIKNPTYYFYNHIIDLKQFDVKLLKIDKKLYKNIGIYITIKKIDDYEKIYIVNPFYLLISHASGFIEEKDVNRYLVFDSMSENKELLKKYSDVFNGIKDKIKEPSDSECDYEKDYMKLKFNFDYILPLNKPVKLHAIIITITSVFEVDCKLYAQVFLDDALYEISI